jgi:hypothetical protein
MFPAQVSFLARGVADPPKDVSMLTCIQLLGPFAGRPQHNIFAGCLNASILNDFLRFLLTLPFGIRAALVGVGTKKIDWIEITCESS